MKKHIIDFFIESSIYESVVQTHNKKQMNDVKLGQI